MDISTSRFSLASMISKWRSAIDGDSVTDEEEEADVVDQEPSWGEWGPDRLLDGFETCVYSMPGRPHLPEEGEGHLIATLIRHYPARSKRAVLYIHGWNDYFFQAHLAQAFEQMGYDFYAIDLHRYGRSFQEGELFGYMEDMDDYYEELDACVEMIKRDHSQVVLNGHSTGGLLAALYGSDRPRTFVGVILNSPWLDMQGSFFFRTLTPPLARGLSMASATMVLPPSENDLYGRSLHKIYEGEWDFDLGLKRIDSHPLRPGWMRAVVNGHDRVCAGLHIDCPVLMVISARSTDPKEWNEECMSTDLALDVDRLAARAPLLGWHVTLVRLQGALHDVALSREDVRNRFFDEIRRWDLAYVRSRAAQDRAIQEMDQNV